MSHTGRLALRMLNILLVVLVVLLSLFMTLQNAVSDSDHVATGSVPAFADPAGGDSLHSLFSGEQFPVGGNPESVALGDFNNDSLLDVATANSNNNNVSVLLGNGGGSFGPQATFSVGSHPACVALGDLNNDGLLDIVTANSDNNNVSVLLGTGDGTFGSEVTFGVGEYPQSVVLGDLNNDSVLDIVTANYDSSDVSVLMGNGDGTLSLSTTLDVGISPKSVALGDLDNDSVLDIVTANYDSSDVSVLLGKGGGTFGSQTTFNVGGLTESVALGDSNNDGLLDIVTANSGGNVSVLLGNGDGTFVSEATFDVGRYPKSVALGDLDNDSLLDIAAANSYTCDVSVLLGKGDGTFASQVKFDVGTSPLSMALGDLNNDSLLDIVAANSSSLVTVLLGEGDGTFGQQATFSVGSAPVSMALGDFNNDSHLDVATTNCGSNDVSVLLGNGDGTFGQRATFSVGTYPLSMALGDLNNDGLLDIVTANSNNNNVSVLLGNGDGAFASQTTFNVGSFPDSVALGDLSSDGVLDIVTANRFSNNVSVLLGRGGGSFGPQTTFSVGSQPYCVALGDLNSDSILDIVTANRLSNNLSVLLGRGGGSFGPQATFSVGSSPYCVALGDLNSDSILDVVAANSNSSNVSVLLGNGAGRFGPQATFSVGSSPYCVALGDLNSDCVLDVVAANYYGNNVSLLRGAGDGTFASQVRFVVGDSPQSVALDDLNNDRHLDLLVANSHYGTVSALVTQQEIFGHMPCCGTGEPVDSVRFHFRMRMNTDSFSLADDIVRFASPSGDLTANGYTWLDARTLEVTFEPQQASGVYEMEIGPEILDSIGNAMNQDHDRVAGEIPDDGYVAIFVIEAPRIVAHTPSSLTMGPVQAICLRFDRPMDATSFSLSEDVVSFTGPSGDLSTTGYRWLDAQRLEVAFEAQHIPGMYEMMIGPRILDVLGNPMDQDADWVAGEAVDDQYTASFVLQGTTPTDLALGVPYHGLFAASGQEEVFRVGISDVMPLLVRLDDESTSDYNELYVRYGSPPTRSNYDYRYSVGGAADQQVFVPMAYPGTWYILVYGAHVPSPSSYLLTATAESIMLVGVTPDHHGNAADASLTLTGAGFDATMTVELIAYDGTAYPAHTVTADSYTQATATFLAGAVPPGTYTVRISKPFGVTAQLTDAFLMTSGGEANLETNLIVPTGMGYHVCRTIYVEYRNAGDVAMPAPLLVLTAEQNGNEGALLTLQRTRLVAGFWTSSAEPEGFSHSVQLLSSGATPGVLQPGESRRVPVYYAGWEQPWDADYPPIVFNLGVLTPENTERVDWSSLKDGMKPSSVSAEAWDALWASYVGQVGTTWGDYVKMLDDNAAYLGRLGQHVVDVGQLLAFEFLQADGLTPLRTLAGAVDATVEAPGLPLVFSRTFAEPISQRYELGSLGRGWSHNWQYSLQQASDGTVTVLGPGGSRRIFQPDSRYSGSYFAQPGDYGILGLNGGILTLQEPDGLLFSFSVDGKLDCVEDNNANRITCAYTSDLLISLTHSSGQSLLIAYNAAGRIQSVTDSVGRQTTFTYDAANEHLLTVQGYDGQITSYSYIAGQGAALENALTEIAYPGATHRYFAYDAEGHLVGTSRDGNAEAVTFAYDAGKSTATDALGNSSKFFFDHRGLLVKTEDALGNAVYMGFDDFYNLTKLTDPAGRSYTYVYDSRGNLVRSTDPLGYVTRFSHNESYNRLALVTDARGNVTRYGYDSQGNLTSVTYADGSIESWGYDSLGEAVSWTNRREHVVGYTYDDSGRITRKDYADGSHIDYTYDARGNLVSTDDPAGTTTYTYDANDYLLRIDCPGGRWLQFTYDAVGRRGSSLDQTGHRLDYHYDAVGRLESLTDESGAEVVRYHYDAAGRIDRKALDNGIYTTYEYDASGQLLHLVNCKADDSVLSRFDYTYDSRGRRISMDTSYGPWTLQYDDVGQLVHAVLDSTDPDVPDQDLTYVYDALGNRISTIENGVTTEYTSNSMNQYTQVGDTTYVFDADGNLIEEQSRSGTISYTYSDENRLTSVADDTDTWQYVYDALGNRVSTSKNGVTTNYVIDPIGLGNMVSQYDAAGNLIARYDYGLGLLSRTDAAGDTAYYTFDAIGNTSELVTAAGSVANSYTYGPFGTLLQSIETGVNSFQFVGQLGTMHEENGLDYMRARFYDPSTGRYVSDDPMGLASGSANLLRYCSNNPITFVDPAGESVAVPLGGGLVIYASAALPAWVVVTAGVLLGVIIVEIVVTGQAAWDAWDSVKGSDTTSERNNLPTGYDELPEWLVPGPEYTNPPDSRDPFEPPPWYQPGNQGNFPGGYYRPPTPPTSTDSSTSSEARRPVDPNQKTGSGGFGSSGFVKPNGTFAYRIDFENEPSATTPAQQVVITDQLNSSLDWGTFELAEIGFGDQFIPVPPGTQHFETSVPVTYDGMDFEVHIVVELDLVSGRLTAHFYSIDPDTGLPPAVDIGLLPPEDGTGRGMGHVSYIIESKSSLPTGTEIRNVALISFDNQPEIATNQVDPHDPSQGTDPTKECLNTIDAGAPTSQVNALSPETNTLSFTVTWTGADDAGGSGIASYDIYVSDNSGPWTPWLDDTADASGIFAGQAGHTYDFFSIARDNVGHVEAAPAVPDATTTVSVITITASAGPGGSITPSGTVVVNYGADQAFDITADAGYHIADVLVDGVSVGAVGSHTFYGVTANHAISVTFAIDTFTITASAGPGGSITPSGTVVVNYGADQAFDITADAGYHIADVLVDGVSVGAVGSHTFYGVTANHAISVTFAIDTFTITASAGPGGSITPSGTVVVNYGADQAFDITADAGYHIADVLVDGVSVGAVGSHTFYGVTANHTVSATFAIDQYTLVVTTTGNGSVSRNPNQTTYSYGAVVSLTATADPGWSFVGWSGDLVGYSNPAAVTMRGNMSITATFAKVQKVNTATSVVSSANPSVYGQRVTFVALVWPSARGFGVPTGSVTFKDGAAILGSGTLNAWGLATFSTSSLSVGKHSITAMYGGDTNFNGSTSSALTQKVDKAKTTVKVVSSVNPSVSGQLVTFTATISPSEPGAGTPTGTVTFKDGAKILGTGTLDATGKATLSTSSLSVGSHSITVVYGGDGSFGSSTSSVLSQNVKRR